MNGQSLKLHFCNFIFSILRYKIKEYLVIQNVIVLRGFLYEKECILNIYTCIYN